jgi:hypothetical protein
MKKITESQLIEQARGLRAYMSEADPAAPAPAAPSANPWEGKDPAKAAAWAKLSPMVQKKIGMADPTDKIIVGRMAQGEFGGLFGGGATDANKDGTANAATQVAQAQPAVNAQVDKSLARFKELLAKASGAAVTTAVTSQNDPAMKDFMGESVNHFLNKLRLLESIQINEALTPAESAELDTLARSYGDSEDPTIQALMKQYSDIKNAALSTPTTVTPGGDAKTPVNRDAMSFSQAFADARAKGEKQFTWKGKPYTTELAKPGATPPAKAPPAQPAPPKAGPPAELQKSNPADLMTGRDATGKPVMKGSPLDVSNQKQPIQMPSLTKESVTFSNEAESLARIIDLSRR